MMLTAKQARYKRTDLDYTKKTIEEVRHSSDGGYSVTCTDCLGCYVDNVSDVIPEIGDTIRLYGNAEWGGIIRGIDIIKPNGESHTVRYNTPKEQDALHKKELQKMKDDKKKKFKENKSKLDEAYRNLPEVFQKRINKFRKNNRNFRVDYEDYEMFCCTEAIKIADKLKTGDAIKDFHKLDYEDQIKLVDIDPGHSGNTFGIAVALAYQYVTTPDNVALMHGALAPLVGSEEYGCVPRIRKKRNI
ncbi:MAG: hypothetical protein WC783_00225 [Candidatus Paceibacterota bacterium]|jgi:hypothetical protein